MNSDLPARIRKRWGKLASYDPDGYGMEWETDELAEEAAKYIELLESLVSHRDLQLKTSRKLLRGNR